MNLNDLLQAVEDFIEVVDSPLVPELCSISRGSKKRILITSELHDFEYPVRTWSMVECPPLGPTDIQDIAIEDPYGDFPTEEWDPPKIQHHVGGFYLEEILKAIETPTWLMQDYVSFYTAWSQQGQGQYDDDSDLFPIYFPPAEQNRLFLFFGASKGDR